MAVAGMMADSENMKGSNKGFLGVESQVLNPSDYVSRDKLNTKGKK